MNADEESMQACCKICAFHGYIEYIPIYLTVVSVSVSVEH